MKMIKKSHGDNKFIEFHSWKKTLFTINHSAKEVEYTLNNFIEKNVDEISSSLEVVIKTLPDQMVTDIINCVVGGKVVEDEDEAASPSKPGQ